MRNKLVEKYIKSRMRNIAVLMCMAVGITSFQLPVLAGEILDNEEVQTINDDISGTKDRSADNYAEDFVTSVSENKMEYTDESDTLSEISENELGQVISENSASDNEVAAGISGIADPRIVPDSSMEAGQKVTWDCIWFGSYWQEDTTGDGIANENDRKQPIKWRVLNVEDNDIFLIADKQLDCQAYLYNASGTSGTTNWGGSTVRRYL